MKPTDHFDLVMEQLRRFGGLVQEKKGDTDFYLEAVGPEAAGAKTAVGKARYIEEGYAPYPERLTTMDTRGQFGRENPLVTASVDCTAGANYINREDAVAGVESQLIKIPYWMCTDHGVLPEETWIRPIIVYRFGKLFDYIRDEWIEDGGVGTMELVSGYRRLGTTVLGKNEDKCGKRDSNDALGHWAGLSIDLRTKNWREGLDPLLGAVDESGNPAAEDTSIYMLDFIAYDFGLYRPMKKTDECHWCLVESPLVAKYPPWVKG